MLLILIPTAWLAILALLVAVCRVAAQGDRQLASSAHRAPVPIGVKLSLPREASPLPAMQRRPHRRTALRRVPTASTRRRSLTAHSGR